MLERNKKTYNTINIDKFVPLQISPSCKGRVSGIPWQITSLTEVQQLAGN